MTTVTVELPFALTHEHELLLRAAERGLDLRPVDGLIHWAEDLWSHGAIIEPAHYNLHHIVNLELMPLGRAILEQCPSLWEPDELEVKLQEMAR